MKKYIYIPAAAFFLGALLLISSCSKKESVYGNGNPATVSATTGSSKSVTDKIRTIVSRIPHTKLVNSANARMAGSHVIASGWDFANPGNGYTYSTSYGVTYSESANTFTLASDAGHPMGGTVVAGPSSLDMNYTFCFSASDHADGINIFNTGAPDFGVSGVIGVSGDFSKLTANSDQSDLLAAFNGLAYYVVYDDKASGTYQVVDWLNSPDLSNTTTLNKQAFAFLIDFKNGRFFISSGGTVTVSGGSMNFSGTYLEVSGFLNSDGNFDLSGDNITYTQVSGFGAMGCN